MRYLVLCLLMGLGFAHAYADTPAGGCDWVSLPQRSSDEQDILIGIRGECPSVAIRSVGGLSVHQMSTVFVCQPLTNPRESWCRLPASSSDLYRPTEVKIYAEDPGQTVDVWVSEPISPTPPAPTPPITEPIEGGGAYLKWRIPQIPVVRWFEFESTGVDTSPTGNTAPVWEPQDQPTAWTYCTSVTAPSGKLWFVCKRDVPYTGRRYRVRACNWSGPNATAGCSGWVEEPYLACTSFTGGSGCPCVTLPSAPGCVP